MSVVKGLYKLDLNVEQCYENIKQNNFNNLEIIAPGTVLATYNNTGSFYLFKFTVVKKEKSITEDKVFVKEKYDGFQGKPKYTQFYFPYLVSLFHSKEVHGDLLQVINVTDKKLSVTEVSSKKAIHLMCNERGVFVFYTKCIVHYSDCNRINKSSLHTANVPLKESIDLNPNSLSHIISTVALLTNGRKIILIDCLFGEILFKSKDLPLPLIKVSFNEKWIVGITVNNINLYNTKTGAEKTIQYQPSPTCIFLENKADFFIIGDAEGSMTAFRLETGEKIYSLKDENNSTEPGEVEEDNIFNSTLTYVGKIGRWKSNYLLCFRPRAISLWEFKEGGEKLATLHILGKASKFAQFEKSIQFRVNENQLWVWAPDPTQFFQSPTTDQKKEIISKDRKRKSLSSITTSLTPRKTQTLSYSEKTTTPKRSMNNRRNTVSANYSSSPIHHSSPKKATTVSTLVKKKLKKSSDNSISNKEESSEESKTSHSEKKKKKYKKLVL